MWGGQGPSRTVEPQEKKNTSTSPFVLMPWCLIKLHQNSFTFSVYLFCMLAGPVTVTGSLLPCKWRLFTFSCREVTEHFVLNVASFPVTAERMARKTAQSFGVGPFIRQIRCKPRIIGTSSTDRVISYAIVHKYQLWMLIVGGYDVFWFYYHMKALIIIF
jgi:hypothetical protein